MDVAPDLAPEEAVALAQAAGWPWDARRVAFVHEMAPRGRFAARDASGRALGMAHVVVWDGPDGALAWIGGMAVAPDARRQGVGRALLRRAIEHAEAEGARAIGLDATREGRPLYEREGFRAFHETAFWERPAGTPRAPPGPSGDYAIYPVSGAEVMELMDYDRPRFGASRARLLARLMSDWPHHSFVAVHRRTGAFSGVAMRFEERVGPLVAESDEAAAWLLHAIETAGAQPRAIVAEWNAHAQALFARAGYARQNATLRMYRGAGPMGRPERVYALPVWSMG